MAKPMEMDPFTSAYIQAALWSSNDESTAGGGDPLDKNYTMLDIAPPTLDGMRRDAKRFQREQGALLQQAYDVPGYDAGTAGHDFWLTRNGHGAGFWDGDLPEELGDRLTAAAKAYGSQDLYVGDDGKVYATGAERWVNASEGDVASSGGVAQDFPSPEDAMHHAAHVGFTHFTHVGKAITLYGPGPDGMSARARLFYAKGKYHISKPGLTKKQIPSCAHVIEHEHHHEGDAHPVSGSRPTHHAHAPEERREFYNVVVGGKIVAGPFVNYGEAMTQATRVGGDVVYGVPGQYQAQDEPHPRSRYYTVEGVEQPRPVQPNDPAVRPFHVTDQQHAVHVKPDGRVVPVTNLGWLTRHKADVVSFDVYPWGLAPVGPAGAMHHMRRMRQWDVVLIAHMRDGGRFESLFADRIVLRNWLPKHGFRGIPLNYLGFKTTAEGARPPHAPPSPDHEVLIDSSHRGVVYRVYKEVDQTTCAVVIAGADGRGWHIEGRSSPEDAEMAAKAAIDAHPSNYGASEASVTPAPPEEAAATMLRRYSSPKKALEMAQIHAHDYAPGTSQHAYWEEVAAAIRRQAHLDPSGYAGEALREKGLVWLHRPDGVYWANATGGTYWLTPMPDGGYAVTWMGADGSREDLGMYSLASAYQVAGRHEPSRGHQQVAEAGQRPPNVGGHPLTLARAKEILKAVGMTISKKVGEYRVNVIGGEEATAYYTDDLEDAVVTGSVMALRHYGRGGHSLPTRTEPYSTPGPSPYALPPMRKPERDYGPNESRRMRP